MPASLTLLAPAKINLYLAVGGRRPDGYHDVVTVLQSLDTRLCDVVTVTEAESFSVVCEPDIGVSVEDNIATRTVSALAEFAGRTPDVAVRIEKHIPAAAGLGGASADAAAVLVGACRLWGIDADTPQVLGLAQSLGADVPFFISGGTAVYGGRGDVLLRRLTTPRLAVVLANADEPVSTPAAYAAFDRLPHPQAPSIQEITSALQARDVTRVAVSLHNDLTDAACSVAPSVAAVLRFVRGLPEVLGALVCGSGSAVFGICADEESAAKVSDRVREAGWWACVSATSAEGVVERVS